MKSCIRRIKNETRSSTPSNCIRRLDAYLRSWWSIDAGPSGATTITKTRRSLKIIMTADSRFNEHRTSVSQQVVFQRISTDAYCTYSALFFRTGHFWMGREAGITTIRINAHYFSFDYEVSYIRMWAGWLIRSGVKLEQSNVHICLSVCGEKDLKGERAQWNERKLGREVYENIWEDCETPQLTSYDSRYFAKLILNISPFYF